MKPVRREEVDRDTWHALKLRYRTWETASRAVRKVILQENIERVQNALKSEPHGAKKPETRALTEGEVRSITRQVARAVGKATQGAEPWSRCARALSGRTVVVHLRTPKTKGAHGNFYRDEDVGYIELHPDLDPYELVTGFFHEVAHAKYHWDTIKPTIANELPSGSLEPRTTGKAYREDPQELEAESQAQEWLRELLGIAPKGTGITERLELLAKRYKEGDHE